MLMSNYPLKNIYPILKGRSISCASFYQNQLIWRPNGRAAGWIKRDKWIYRKPHTTTLRQQKQILS